MEGSSSSIDALPPKAVVRSLRAIAARNHDRTPLEIRLDDREEIVDPQIDRLDLSRLHVAHQPVQLGKPVIEGRIMLPEWYVIGELARRRTNQCEPTDGGGPGAPTCETDGHVPEWWCRSCG
jgi:hypothetical protein